MTRSVEEWRGKDDDTKVPPRVRARIFLREGGRCWISGRKIGPADAWDLDHKIALCNGGAHAEHNLFPALRDKHREKTRDDIDERVKTDRIRAKFIGTWERRGPKIQSRGFDKRRPPSSADQTVSRDRGCNRND